MSVMDVLGWTVIPRPDLSVSGLAVATSGVTFTVGNGGSAASAASAAGVYLSTDANISTTADIKIGSSATPALALQGTDIETVALNLPTNPTPGTYYIGVIADDADAVIEFNENNNASNPAQ